MPPVSTKEQIDNLINVTAPSLLGADYEARFTTPSIMKLTIIDSTGTNLASGVSQFQINSSAPLKHAPGTENFTSNLVTLQGGFDQIIPPFITAFVAEDPVVSSTTDAENNDEELFDQNLLVQVQI